MGCIKSVCSCCFSNRTCQISCISELEWMKTVWGNLGGNTNTEFSTAVFFALAGNSHKTLRLRTLGGQRCEANHSNGQQSLYPPIQRPLITLRRYWPGAPYATQTGNYRPQFNVYGTVNKQALVEHWNIHNGIQITWMYHFLFPTNDIQEAIFRK